MSRKKIEAMFIRAIGATINTHSVDLKVANASTFRRLAKPELRNFKKEVTTTVSNNASNLVDLMLTDERFAGLHSEDATEVLSDLDSSIVDEANLTILGFAKKALRASNFLGIALRETSSEIVPVKEEEKKSESEDSESQKKKKILMIDYGNMGRPIAEGVLKKFGDDVELIVVNPSPRELPSGVKYYSSVDGLPEDEQFDAVFISVKPQVAPKILPSYQKHMKEGTIVISIMAGTPIESLQGMLGSKVKTVRTMPSICADVGKSPTGVAVAKGDNFSKDESDFVTKLIESFGEAVYVKEKRINAITAVAGSGPAYVYRILESLSRVVEKQFGLEYDMAKQLVLDTTIHGVRPVGNNKPDLEAVKQALSKLEGKDSVTNLIEESVKSFGKDANPATITTLVNGIMLRFEEAYIAGAKSLEFNDEDARK